LIPAVPGFVSLFSIQITYFWARANDHVKPFPYITITESAEKYPECMLFRAGIIATCVFIAASFHVISWWLLFLNERFGNYVEINVKKIRILGYICSGLLTVSTGTISDGGDMNQPLHLFCASTFFVVIYWNLNIVTNVMQGLWQYKPRYVRLWSYYY
jgi:hypothetical protein